MKREDDIMAGYLLKGGKMLAKSCPSCGCPLFEYKGETLCVVCREDASERKPGEGEGGKEVPVVPETVARPAPASPALADALEEAITALCLRMKEERDPGQVLVLANAVKTGVKALRMLR